MVKSLLGKDKIVYFYQERFFLLNYAFIDLTNLLDVGYDEV